MADGLVIGTQDITAKDQALLKALVRLLNGGVNIQARFSEQLEECNVVFVPGDMLYADAGAQARAPRLLLHACSLAFEHPLHADWRAYTSAPPF